MWLAGQLYLEHTVRCLVIVVGLTHDELVLASQEGIVEHGYWLQVDVRVGAFSLASARAIKVPPGQF